MILSDSTPTHAQLVMSEFNSASCGGIPGISDTFGVGSLWTVDYALQMASVQVGYSAAYIHTREAGISYNLMTPPSSKSDSDSEDHGWTTNPPFYALIATAEILQSDTSVKVVDLNVGGSKQNKTSDVAGYAIYDVLDSSLTRVVLFNFAKSKAAFTLPNSTITAAKSPNLQVKFLSSNDLDEKQKIAWGGLTYDGVKDGQAVNAPENSTWAKTDVELDCSKNCTLDVQGPAMAVLFLNPPLITAISVNRPESSSLGSPAPPMWFWIATLVALLSRTV